MTERRAAGGLWARNRQMRVGQVLDAASTLFAERGYEATRIEEIAKRAAVAPTTIYNYFTSKPNILLALAVRHVRASLPERHALVRNPPNHPIAAVQAFERLLADQALRHLSRECWRVIMASPYREPGGDAHRTAVRLNQLIRSHYVRMLSGFKARGTIKAGVDVEALAELVYAIGTHHFGRLISNDAMTVNDLKTAVERHLDLVFAGVIAEPEPRRTRKSRKELQ
jgi:AcrR family transcriptional regulator